MPVKKIRLKNFTVFDDIEIDLCDGINIFIGNNGYGKTHILKIIYSFCISYFRKSIENIGGRDLDTDLITKLFNCFQINKLGELVKNYSIVDIANAIVEFDDKIISFGIKNGDLVNYDIEIDIKDRLTNDTLTYSEKKPTPTVFIPAKEMLTHSRLEKDYLDRVLPFDTTLIDIINKAGVSTKRVLPDYMTDIMEKISKIIDGVVLYKNDRFYIEKSNGLIIDFFLEAEGLKKLGLVYRLIETGYLTKESVLIWDEPESNIDPSNIAFVVDILLELQKNGVQIFIATHNYYFAKYLHVRKTINNAVLYHSLYKDKTILVETEDNFDDINNNLIINQSINLYKEEVKKVME